MHADQTPAGRQMVERSALLIHRRLSTADSSSRDAVALAVEGHEVVDEAMMMLHMLLCRAACRAPCAVPLSVDR